MKLNELFGDNATHVAIREFHANNIAKTDNNPAAAIFDGGDKFIFSKQQGNLILFTCIDYRPDITWSVDADNWNQYTQKL